MKFIKTPLITSKEFSYKTKGEMMMNTFDFKQIKSDLSFLCAPEQAGRLSGTIGAKNAALYIADSLKQMGFQPIGGEGYFEKVHVPAARLVSKASLKIGKWNLLHRIEYGEITTYGGGKAEGELLVVKNNQDLNEEELKGKIVLIPLKTDDFNLNETVKYAKGLGVRAVLIDGGEPRWFHKSVMGNYETLNSFIPVLRIRSSLLPELIRLSGSIVTLNLPIETSSKECQNVMGYYPGESESTETIALVSHYDFLGDDPGGHRFEGAGDNAAGVATILEVSRQIASLPHKLPFNLLTVFTTGEESNLWGEKHLISNPPLPLSKTIYLDGLGRTPYYSLNVSYHSEDKNIINSLMSKSRDMGVSIKVNESIERGLFNFLVTGTSSVKFRPYHTPDDTYELIHVNVLQEVANLLVELLMIIK